MECFRSLSHAYLRSNKSHYSNIHVKSSQFTVLFLEFYTTRFEIHSISSFQWKVALLPHSIDSPSAMLHQLRGDKALTNQSDLRTSVAKNQTIIGEEDWNSTELDETRVAVSLLGARQGLHLHPRNRPFFRFSCQTRKNEVKSR